MCDADHTFGPTAAAAVLWSTDIFQSNILLYFDVHDVCLLARSCKSWDFILNKDAESNTLWHRLLMRDAPVLRHFSDRIPANTDEIPTQSMDWKKIFKRAFVIMRFCDRRIRLDRPPESPVANDEATDGLGEVRRPLAFTEIPGLGGEWLRFLRFKVEIQYSTGKDSSDRGPGVWKTGLDTIDETGLLRLRVQRVSMFPIITSSRHSGELVIYTNVVTDSFRRSENGSVVFRETYKYAENGFGQSIRSAFNLLFPVCDLRSIEETLHFKPYRWSGTNIDNTPVEIFTRLTAEDSENGYQIVFNLRFDMKKNNNVEDLTRLEVQRLFQTMNLGRSEID